jgi:hypothetical protein
VSLAAALYQRAVGPSALMALGLEYGTTVRSYFGELRAPGIFLTNYELGAFAGVLGALAVVWWPKLGLLGERDRWWRLAALVSSVGCLLLSIYRTGLVVLLASLGLWLIFGSGGAGRLSAVLRNVSLLAGSLGLVGVVLSGGYASTDSLIARQAQWSSILTLIDWSPTGLGVGAVGAASVSRFAEDPVVVDNYVISSFLQFGWLGPLALFALACFAASHVRDAARTPVLNSFFVLFAACLAFLLVDFWEYTAAMSLAMFAAGVAYAARARAAGGPPEVRHFVGVPAHGFPKH